jgi:hypothetical protein
MNTSRWKRGRTASMVAAAVIDGGETGKSACGLRTTGFSERVQERQQLSDRLPAASIAYATAPAVPDASRKRRLIKAIRCATLA